MFFDKNKAKNIKAMSGVLELSPSDQIQFDQIKKTISETYEKFGFSPFDVSTIERAEILFAKGGGDTEKEIYRIQKGDNDLALRFDLTVPLARYVAANYHDITFPFRRYQIGKVFRGERPQKGRFRELYQCDIDIVGEEKLDLKNDAEIPSIIYSIFNKLNIGPFVIKINNRKILAGFLSNLDLENKSAEVLRIVDKVAKIGEAKVKELLLQENISSNDVDKILNFIKITGSNSEIINSLKKLGLDNEKFLEGVDELEQTINFLDLFNIPKDYYQIDLTVVRGLDYYTGTVYETFLIDYPEFGSICSGGRYDDLVGYYTDKKLVGVGISIGLTRLFSQLKERGILNKNKKTISDLVVIPLGKDFSEIVSLANFLRRKNVKTELLLEDWPFKKKLNYANKKAVEYILIVGEDEIKSQKFTLKNMKNGEQQSLTQPEIVDFFESLKFKKI
jgi:histidyl-tRNA synthetase